MLFCSECFVLFFVFSSVLTVSFSLLYLPFPKNEAVISLGEAPPGEEPDFTILCCLTPPDVFISSPLNYMQMLSLPGPCYMGLCHSLEVTIPFSYYNFLFHHVSPFFSLNLLQILLLPTPSLIGQPRMLVLTLVLSFFFFLLAALRSIRDLSSPTRD